MSAPLFRTVTPLERVYGQWAEHYNACVECQRDDWYAPPAGERLFCADGQRLFRAWVAKVFIGSRGLPGRPHSHQVA